MGWNDLIGHHLHHYEILDELGRGGSSRVYRAYDPQTQRDVAIKVIPNEADDRATFVRRFEREVEVVRQLNHPNIVAVYSTGETDDLVYLVMQCVSGGTLRQRLGRPLAYGEAAAYIVQMARALHSAHVRGIVHRDVKPSNMLVDAADPRHLLLTDFGIAKIQGARGLTKTGTTIGTPEYMSPEQAEGREIDQRADIYALGCVLYEMLAGRPPFVGATPVSVLYQQVHSRPAYMRGFNPDVPRELAHITEVALAKRPEDRFGTGEAFAEALLPFCGGSLPSTSSLLTPRPTPSPQPEIWRPTAPPASPYRFAPVPRLQDTGGLFSPSSEAQAPRQRLGAEGLDALFPDDLDDIPAASAPLPPWLVNETAAPASGITERQAEPEVARDEQPTRPQPTPRQSRQTIPLPSFRLPAKQTKPLDLPLTADGQLDLEALLAQHERRRAHADAAVGNIPATPAAPAPPAHVPEPQPALPDLDGPPLAPPFAPQPPAFGAAPPPFFTPKVAEIGGAPLPPSTPSYRTGAPRTSRSYVSAAPVWRPAPEEDDTASASITIWSTRRSRQRRRPTVLASSAVAAALVLSLVGWLVVSALGLGVPGQQRLRTAATPDVSVAAKHTATPAPTATSAPTATAGPTATPTVNPRQQLDAEAAAMFRAVTLGRFRDGSCSSSNNVTRFSSGETIYFNMCTSGSATAGPMTLTIRQNGATVVNVGCRVYLSPGASYWCNSSYGLAPGSYDVLITVDINGTSAGARDLSFTVQ